MTGDIERTLVNKPNIWRASLTHAARSKYLPVLVFKNLSWPSNKRASLTALAAPTRSPQRFKTRALTMCKSGKVGVWVMARWR